MNLDREELNGKTHQYNLDSNDTGRGHVSSPVMDSRVNVGSTSKSLRESRRDEVKTVSDEGTYWFTVIYMKISYLVLCIF